MTSFFWVTLVGSILGLLYAFSRGEGDGWGIAKVALSTIIMIALLVNWYNSGEDALSSDDPTIFDDPNPGLNPYVDPTIPDGYDSHQQFWQEQRDKAK